MTISQGLTLVGLLFEALSVAYTARGVYLFRFTDKARYERHQEEMAKWEERLRQWEAKGETICEVSLMLLYPV